MTSNYKSKLAQAVEQYADILTSGYLLAIDPSSGSAGSLPGFAIFKAGVLEDAGVIQLPRGGRAISNRLWLLRQALESEFDRPDLLAVELISPIMPTKGGAFMNKSASSLIKSVGAILSTWDVDVIEPSPSTWHALVDKALLAESALLGTPLYKYQKTDAKDAVAIGWSAIATLAQVQGRPQPPLPEILKS